MFTVKKKGSLIVDAAIVLPVFLIAMGMLLMLSLQCGAEMEHFHKLSQRTLYLCLAEAASGVSPEGRSEVLASGQCVDHVQTLPDIIDTKIPIPQAFRRHILAEMQLSFRPFVGESGDGDRTDDIMVYVFERYGERYHIEGCCILVRERKRDNKEYSYMSRSEAESKGYTACRLCIGGEEWGFTQ